jgi:hypothetical protein
MAALRMYVDASVVGGCFEPQYAEGSGRLFELVRQGRIVVLVSDFVIEELFVAPTRVQEVLSDLPAKARVRVKTTKEAIRLRDAYLDAQILGEASVVDATHVAMATVLRADAIVSWNFRHIVHVEKMRRFNEVNLAEGFGPLTIVSPNEVRFGSDESD